MKPMIQNISDDERVFVTESIHSQVTSLLEDLENPSMWKDKRLDDKISVVREGGVNK